MTDDAKLIEAIKAYKQADMDGVMVLVSREACDKAADRLAALSQVLTECQEALIIVKNLFVARSQEAQDLRQSLNVLGDKYDELSEKYHILKASKS